MIFIVKNMLSILKDSFHATRQGQTKMWFIVVMIIVALLILIAMIVFVIKSREGLGTAQSGLETASIFGGGA